MIINLAQTARTVAEAAEETASGIAGLFHWAELGVTALLVVATFSLFYATSKVHHDEVAKMGDHLADANDNMTDVALAEIDAHHTNRRRMQYVHSMARTMRRAQTTNPVVRKGDPR